MIIADGIVGLINEIAKSGSYAPTGGLESGFHLYLPPIVILFGLYPKSVKCPSYYPGLGNYSFGLRNGETYSLIVAAGIVGFTYDRSGSY